MAPDGFGPLTILAGAGDSPFGRCFVAGCGAGIVRMAFPGQDEWRPVEAELARRWAGFEIVRDARWAQETLARVFGEHGTKDEEEAVLVRGTGFQIAVWRALLDLTDGELVTYGGLARRIGRPGAARAVGSAVGANPVAWLIPCHQVVPAGGGTGGYRWGPGCKERMIAAGGAARKPDQATNE